MKATNRFGSRVGAGLGKVFRLSTWGTNQPWRPVEVVTLADLRRARAARKGRPAIRVGRGPRHRQAA